MWKRRLPPPLPTAPRFIERLASASEVIVGERFELDGAVSIVTADATIKIPMDELVDRRPSAPACLKRRKTSKSS